MTAMTTMNGTPQRLAIIGTILFATFGVVALMSIDAMLDAAGALLLATSVTVTYWIVMPCLKRRQRTKPNE